MDVQTAHYFQIDLEIVENADFSNIIPRFPFNVKIGFPERSFLHGKTRVNRVWEGALKSSQWSKNDPKMDENSRKYGIHGIEMLILHGKTRIK